MNQVTLTLTALNASMDIKEFDQLIEQYRFLVSTMKSIIEWQDSEVTRPEVKDLMIRNAARAALQKVA